MPDYGLTADNLLSALPSVLKNDAKMLAVAKVVASTLADRRNEVERASIYTNLGEVDEDVLDILAEDFSIAWYNYNASKSVKAKQIKSQAIVHKTIGTKGAVVKSITDTYNNSIVEEWFEYGGNPYCFRVIINIDEESEIVDDDFYRALNIFKSFRSHLEYLSYRCSSDIVVSCIGAGVAYATRLCGTYPQTMTIGDIESNPTGISADYDAISYNSVLCGTTQGGVL